MTSSISLNFSRMRKLLLLCILSSALLSHHITADDIIVTSRIFNSTIASGNISENLFEIKNDDYYKTKKSYNVTFNYSIFSYEDNNRIIEKKESIRINNFKYKKTTGLGKFRFENGTKYDICIEATFYSTETNDNKDLKICWNYSIGYVAKQNKKKICSMSAEISVEDYSAKMNPEKINFKVLPIRKRITNESNGTEDFVIEYWIDDIYGNILKRKANTSSSSKKTFTIKDNLMMTIIIHARIYNKTCTNVENNTETSVAIIINPEKVEKNPIEILDIKQIESVVFVKMALFRNTSDNKIDLWIENNNEKISNIYTINIHTMYADAIFTIPISILDTNEDKNAQLIIDGFGTRMKNIIELKVKENTSKNYSKKEIETNKSSTRKTVEKDFFIKFITSNKTENVINSPNVNVISQ